MRIQKDWGINFGGKNFDSILVYLSTKAAYGNFTMKRHKNKKRMTKSMGKSVYYTPRVANLHIHPFLLEGW